MAPSRAQFGHKTLSELKLKFMVHLIQNSFLIFYKMCILETQNKLWTYNSIKNEDTNKLRLSEINQLYAKIKKVAEKKLYKNSTNKVNSPLENASLIYLIMMMKR